MDNTEVTYLFFTPDGDRVAPYQGIVQEESGDRFSSYITSSQADLAAYLSERPQGGSIIFVVDPTLFIQPVPDLNELLSECNIEKVIILPGLESSRAFNQLYPLCSEIDIMVASAQSNSTESSMELIVFKSLVRDIVCAHSSPELTAA